MISNGPHMVVMIFLKTKEKKKSNVGFCTKYETSSPTVKSIAKSIQILSTSNDSKVNSMQCSLLRIIHMFNSAG